MDPINGPYIAAGTKLTAVTGSANGPRSRNWWDEPLSWAGTVLRGNSEAILDHSIVRGSTPNGCLIRIRTSQGGYYFKAVPSLLAHEPRLALMLNCVDSAHFPTVLAIDDDRHWFLMTDVVGARLRELSNVDVFHEALHCFAAAQIECSSHIGHLLVLGCPDHRLAALSAQMGPFFALASEFADQNQYGFLSGISVPRIAERLRKLYELLAQCGFPETLGHGDFSVDNILVTDSGPSYLDWAEGYAGNPFFVLADFLSHLALARPDMKPHLSSIRQAYFLEWLRFQGLQELDRVFALSRPFAILRLAIRQVDIASRLGHLSVQAQALPRVICSLVRHIHDCSEVL